MPDETERAKIDLQEYTCERCGFKYRKVFDYPPFLCYKCMRFVSKRTVSTVKQIVPTYTHVENGEV
jgi:protein-arginine kinase activator protein McsA